jgi:tetratricopeptide (TPR) repeat protein
MTRVLVVALVLAGGVAAAQPAPEETQKAAALYDRGKRHFDIAEYAAAIAAWKEAYLLSSEPLLLFNIAQAHRLAGDCAQANRFYLNYKRVAPRPANQAELDSAMAKCAGIAPATGDTTPANALPPIAVEPAPPTPTPAPATPPPDTVEVDQGRTLRYSGLAIGGAGAVAGIIAIVYAVRASEKADEIADRPIGTAWSKELDQVQADGQSAQTRARIFGVIGAVGLLGGAAVWYYGRTKSNIKVDVAVAPRGDAHVSLSCAF